MNKYAVLIGNSQFPDEADKSKLPDLACPERDVDGLAKVLSSERGEFEVLPLKNLPSHQILRQLQRQVKQAQQDDLLLLYYSGHGKPNPAGMLHLATSDTVISELETSAIPINRVYDILSTGKCRKIVIILDCCYSGAAGYGHKGDLNAQLQQLNNSRGTYLVTASTGMQVAHESAADGLSLFTKHLIAGLETGDADKGGDGLVDMDELYDYVYSKVKAENPNQEPTEYATDKRGELIIAKSGRDSRKERAEKIRLLLLELEKQDEGVAEIKTEALSIAKLSHPQLSTTQLQQDELLSELLSQKITLLSFVRKWDRLTFDKAQIVEPRSEIKSDIIKSMPNNIIKIESEYIVEPEIETTVEIKPETIIPVEQHDEDWQVIGKYKVKDGLAIDTQTRLMWVRFAYGQTWQNATAEGEAKAVNRKKALDIVKNFNERCYGGYNNWRLPNDRELKTLIDKTKGKNSNYIDTDVFPNNTHLFWSKTNIFNMFIGWVLLLFLALFIDGIISDNLIFKNNTFISNVIGIILVCTIFLPLFQIILTIVRLLLLPWFPWLKIFDFNLAKQTFFPMFIDAAIRLVRDDGQQANT